MAKFNKVLNFTIIALVAGVLLIGVSTAYSYRSEPIIALRVPVGQKTTFNRMNEAKKVPRLVAHGDIHAALEEFKENLRKAGLIDDNDKWIGGKSILVQVGDVIDRGPHSIEAYEFLEKLQIEARQAGGDVIRLLGNHELMLLQGNYSYANFDNPEKLAVKIKEDILSGKVTSAYVFGNRLFIHGGLRSKVREILKKEISEEKGIPMNEITEQDIADRINNIVIMAMNDPTHYNHAIFQADAARGGSADVGGIFWNDFDDLMASIGANEIKQIVGHSPEMFKGFRGKWSDSLGRIDIDAGLFGGYGGNQAFLIIEDNEIKVVAKNDQDRWEEETLGIFMEETEESLDDEMPEEELKEEDISIIKANLTTIFSEEFEMTKMTLHYHTMVGGYVGVNIVIDSSGKIVGFGNFQNLSRDIQAGINKGELYRVSIGVNAGFNGPDYKYNLLSEEIPEAAKKVLYKTVQAANKAKGGDDIIGAVAEVINSSHSNRRGNI